MSARTVATGAGPVVWGFLGYSFDAAPMIVGLIACLIVRLYIGFKNHTKGAVVVDTLVTALSMLFTAVLILTKRPDPFTALIEGTGIGAMGAQIIVFAFRKAKTLGFISPDDDADDEPKRVLRSRPDDEQAIYEAIKRISGE